MTETNATAGARARTTTIVCEGCGDQFHPVRPGQTNCRPSCRAQASRKRQVARRGALLDALDDALMCARSLVAELRTGL